MKLKEWKAEKSKNKFNTLRIKSSSKNHSLVMKHHDIIVIWGLSTLLCRTVLKWGLSIFLPFSSSRLYHFMCSMMIIIIFPAQLPTVRHGPWCIYIFSLWYFILTMVGLFLLCNKHIIIFFISADVVSFQRNCFALMALLLPVFSGGKKPHEY